MPNSKASKKYFFYSPATNASPIPPITTSRSDNKELVLLNDARPTIVLLGWVGGHAKHLLKYVELWNNKGFNCLYYPVPLIEFLFPYLTLLVKATKVLRELQSYIQESNCKSIIFNVFSNGGGFMYGHFIRILYSNAGQKEFQVIRNAICGTVFDSAPGVSWGAGIHVIRAAAQTKLQSFLALLILPLAMSQWIPYCASYQGVLADSRNRWNHLVLYSKKDNFVPYQQVNIFIQLLKKNILKPTIKSSSTGGSSSTSSSSTDLVQTQCFENSPHVMHLKVNPKEYSLKIDQFIKSIINNNNNNNQSSKFSITSIV
ncbi:hypothetical protein DFA_11099 [Cavenderia fasciculata]|uniref:Transmembrane protein n=1 Tax=Cavenderia fasciculata TaxID=261658 RepID=F4QES7_CACFS|nr:uncharacterized protein DFA_11099 [Cavenderia fasciculata]EGG13338.1 hypothetical protein DFA_11099 [Cavenderia fasciculata]|eukprot:XP_004350042.1 hypothetical protein DFA_11099 [Cavenderia fasciculata]